MIRITQGFLSGKKVLAPKTGETRPTKSRVREAIFHILQEQIVGSTMLDLFAGSGIMGFEAISRGVAKHCFFIDRNPLAVKTIKNTARNLGIDQRISVYKKDVLSFLKTLREQSALIYLDPPYSMHDLKKEMETLLTILHNRNLLAPGGKLFLEMPKDISITPPEDFSHKRRPYGNTHIWELFY